MKKRIGYRIFLISGDEVSPLTKTAFDELVFGRQAVLRAFGGKTVDIATVVCRLENAKLSEIVRIYCQRFRIRADGALDERHPQDAGRPAPRTIDRALRNDQRIAHTLTMISSAAQKKILDVLWK